MELRLAKRMRRTDFQGDFLTMILKVATNPSIISFAGGLPNPASFPVEAVEVAACKVLREQGKIALQYSTPAGYLPLRELLADRCRKNGMKNVTADDILITNGSQQGLDIIAAAFIDEDDPIMVERPSYLAALQVFHLYNPKVHTVELTPTGASVMEVKQIIEREKPKFFYAIPNFQNPTGLTYSEDTRKEIADIVRGTDTFLVEDNPYGELRFHGEKNTSFNTLLGEQCLLLGTFSKIVSPGLRIGWIVCPHKELREQMISYKQRVDMHTNIFGQMVLARYLQENDLDTHIEKIKTLYGHQAQTMLAAMEQHFPEGVTWTRPDGGMFIWATLPHGLAAVELANEAAKAGVAIAAGDPFYETDRNMPTFRLNYTNCDDDTIVKGITILGEIIRKMLKR